MHRVDGENLTAGNRNGRTALGWKAWDGSRNGAKNLLAGSTQWCHYPA